MGWLMSWSTRTVSRHALTNLVTAVKVDVVADMVNSVGSLKKKLCMLDIVLLIDNVK